MGFSGLPWILLFLNLVEAAGVKPIFVNPYKSLTCDAVAPRPRMWQRIVVLSFGASVWPPTQPHHAPAKPGDNSSLKR